MPAFPNARERTIHDSTYIHAPKIDAIVCRHHTLECERLSFRPRCRTRLSRSLCTCAHVEKAGQPPE
eukprot:6968462-Prymnesium_polylepis.1